MLDQFLFPHSFFGLGAPLLIFSRGFLETLISLYLYFDPVFPDHLVPSFDLELNLTKTDILSKCNYFFPVKVSKTSLTILRLGTLHFEKMYYFISVLATVLHDASNGQSNHIALAK